MIDFTIILLGWAVFVLFISIQQPVEVGINEIGIPTNWR